MTDNKKLVEQVKRLREELELGMMEIKAALEEANGDETKAREILKAAGAKKAEKRAEKEVHQGVVATYTHSNGKIGCMVEVLCETDFVAKNEEFMNVTRDLCLQVAAMNPETTEVLLEQDFIKDGSKKVKDLVTALVAKFGENIKVGRIVRFEI